MISFYHLEQHKLIKIEDRHFTDDPSAIMPFIMMLQKHKFFRDAVNEMLTYISPLPVKYKDQILYELD